MIKSNSKQAKNNIRNYVSKIYTGEETDNGLVRFQTFEYQARHINEVFEKEMCIGYNKNRNRQSVFYDWCAGLCGVIDTADYFCYNSAVDVLGDILEQTTAEREKYTRYDAEKMLTYLIYREINTVCARG